MKEIILKVASEGGSLTLERETKDGQWRFHIRTEETALFDMLSEEDRSGIPFAQAAHADSFEAALSLLDEYPWITLQPIEVQPHFVEAILSAVKKRGGTQAEGRWRKNIHQLHGRTQSTRPPDWPG
jgi:hypothetical protein